MSSVPLTPTPAPSGPLGFLENIFKNIPPWLGPAVEKLVQAAEELFGPGTGEQKEAFVIAALQGLLHNVPTGPVPSFIATPIEDEIVKLLVTLAWQKLYGPHSPAGLAKAAAQR